MYRSTRHLQDAWNIGVLKNGRNYLWVIGGFIFHWLLYSWLHHIPPQSTWNLLTSPVSHYPFDTTAWQKTQYLLCSGLVVPVCEEAINRGLIFRKLEETKGTIISIVVSSLVFTVIHHSLDVLYIIQLLAAGILLALTYRYTRSLLFPILLHGIWNIFILYYSTFF
jgi:uncharacterized protein